MRLRLLTQLGFTLAVTMLLSAAGSAAAEGDWPTYLKDNDRSGVSGETLQLPLKLEWTHRAASGPAPSWPGAARQNYSGKYLRSLTDTLPPIKPLKALVTYDRAFHIVSAGGKVYFGSSSEDKVVCLDLKTGRTIWEFFAEGPVRLAPTLHGDKVLFGSDDGRLYCIRTDNGRLVWKTLIGPKDKRLPGNERMISLWPVRTGVVVVGELVYCCAGLFPSQGVFSANVNLSDGKLASRSPLNFSPQGYIRRTGEKLYVDGGRDKPRAMATIPPMNGATPRRKPIRGISGFPHAAISTAHLRIGGGDGLTAAFDTVSGEKLWSAKVDGKAYSLAIAGGRLLVSTSQGIIYCYGPNQAPSSRKTAPTPPTESLGRYDKAAATIIESTRITRGYCLILGSGRNGGLARALAKRTDLKIIIRELDPQAADGARGALSSAGLYGRRVVVHQGEHTRLPYVDNVFNMIVRDHSVEGKKNCPGDSAELKRLVRPQGGVVICGRSPHDLWTKGRMKGSSDWTHLYANASNTINSGDRSINPDATLSLQWFGRPGPEKMIDRHLRGSAHLSCGGRLFVAAKDRIIVVDAYNGSPQWERELKGCSRLGIVKDSSNMAVDNKHLYVVIRDGCNIIDAESGKTLAVAQTPIAKHDWGYLAVTGGRILGSAVKPQAAFDGVKSPRDLHNSSKFTYKENGAVACSDGLFSLDKVTRRTLWSYRASGGVILNSTITVGTESLYFVESKSKETFEDTSGHIGLNALFKNSGRLVCLDATNGKPRWSQDIDLSMLQHNAYGAYCDGKIIVGGSYTKTTPTQKNSVLFEVHALDGKTGKKLWALSLDSQVNISALHGLQNRRPVIVQGQLLLEPYSVRLSDGKIDRLWKTKKRKGCGQVSASYAGLFFREGGLSMFDMNSKRLAEITRITRPGCWINAIPAGGVLLMPESSSGCTCKYAIQTSMGFMNHQQ
jgi:outer membrane protein assembly factor BamB